jgi:hypothetical protein
LRAVADGGLATPCPGLEAAAAAVRGARPGQDPQPDDAAAWDPTAVAPGSDLIDEVGRPTQAACGDIPDLGAPAC